LLVCFKSSGNCYLLTYLYCTGADGGGAEPKTIYEARRAVDQGLAKRVSKTYWRPGVRVRWR
jgi:hypothetical protein